MKTFFIQFKYDKLFNRFSVIFLLILFICLNTYPKISISFLSPKSFFKKDYTNININELINKGETSLKADNGAIFTFLYKEVYDDESNDTYYLLQIKHNNKIIGHMDILGNLLDRSHLSNISTDLMLHLIRGNRALEVNRSFRKKYHGLGTTLMGIGMRISKLKGYDNFIVNSDVNAKDFYQKLGFETIIYDNEEWNDYHEGLMLKFPLNEKILPSVNIKVKPNESFLSFFKSKKQTNIAA